jgi:hypothetical protein
MSKQEEATVGAEVVVAAQEEEGLQVAQVVRERERFWEWPIGTKFYKTGTSTASGEIQYLFYQQSYEHRNGVVEHLFTGMYYTQDINAPLRLQLRSSKFPQCKESFNKTYEIALYDPLMAPITADGYEIKVAEVYMYDFPGRNCNEKCAMVKVLNYAYQVAVCVQNVNVSDRMMVVHANQLRKEKYGYR